MNCCPIRWDASSTVSCLDGCGSAAIVQNHETYSDTVDYQATDLSGSGAKATGGRWNSQGVPVIYAATTIASATLETLAHLGDPRC